MRKAEVLRKTAETSIELALLIDGTGKTDIRTGVGFFDHMLTLFAAHGRFDLTVSCDGDLEVDQHHSIEDIGIVLGQAVREALGDKKGIERYAHAMTPMDEALSAVTLDISGRSFLVFRVDGMKEKVGSFDTELVEEFFLAFTRSSGMTLHIELKYGKNSHHIIESIFKGFGRSLGAAAALNPDVKGVPSTKGIL